MTRNMKNIFPVPSRCGGAYCMDSMVSPVYLYIRRIQRRLANVEELTSSLASSLVMPSLYKSSRRKTTSPVYHFNSLPDTPFLGRSRWIWSFCSRFISTDRGISLLCVIGVRFDLRGTYILSFLGRYPGHGILVRTIKYMPPVQPTYISVLRCCDQISE